MNFPFLKTPNFQVAAESVLKFLRDKLGFQLWMVTRTDNDRWIVLQCEDQGYQVTSGNEFCWGNSICSRMTRGEGPNIVPDLTDSPAYQAAPITDQLPISAYLGFPIKRQDGTLFGTLCAIDPNPQAKSLIDEQEMLELLSGLLGSILEHELRLQDQMRIAEKAKMEAMSDHLTGAFNRRGWESLVAAEEDRCERYGHSACVISMDVDCLKLVNDQQGHAAGDRLLKKVVQVIKNTIREPDVVARLGGDEFAILAVECDELGAQAIEQRIKRQLAKESIELSIGFQRRCHDRSLQQAFLDADQKMYQQKRGKKSNRVPSNCLQEP